MKTAVRKKREEILSSPLSIATYWNDLMTKAFPTAITILKKDLEATSSDCDNVKRLKDKVTKFTGLKGNELFFLPSVSTNDEAFQRVKMETQIMLKDFAEQNPNLFDINDITRLNNNPSLDVEPSYISPERTVGIVMSEYYLSDTEARIIALEDKVGMRPDTYIKKRWDSSVGSEMKVSSPAVMAAMIADFKHLITSENYLKSNFYDSHKLGSPLTRRMMKKYVRGKGKMQSTVDGKLQLEVRELTLENKKWLKQKYDLSDEVLDWMIKATHRIAINVSSTERVIQFLFQPSVEAFKDIFSLTVKYHDKSLELLADRGFIMTPADTSSYDQTVKDRIMNAIYRELSKSVEIFDLEAFRANKDDIWYNDNKDKFESASLLAFDYIQELLNNELKFSEAFPNINSIERTYIIDYLKKLNEENVLIALDSGEFMVSNDGKKIRVLSDETMLNKYFCDLPVGDDTYKQWGLTINRREVLKRFSKYKIPHNIRTDGKDESPIFCLNSSDDHVYVHTEMWVRDALIAIHEWNKDQVIHDFMMCSIDIEFLSIHIVDNFDEKKYGRNKMLIHPNIIRRFTSMLCPEYSCFIDSSHTTIRDIEIGFKDKFNEIIKHPLGKEVWHKFEQIWKKYFKKNFFLHVHEDKYSGNWRVHQPEINILSAEKVEITPEMRAILTNPEKIYYRDDLIEKINSQMGERNFERLLFINVSPKDTLECFRNCNAESVIIKNQKKYINSLKESINQKKHYLNQLGLGDDFALGILGIQDQDKMLIRLEEISEMAFEDQLNYYKKLEEVNNWNILNTDISITKSGDAVNDNDKSHDELDFFYLCKED